MLRRTVNFLSYISRIQSRELRPFSSVNGLSTSIHEFYPDQDIPTLIEKIVEKREFVKMSVKDFIDEKTVDKEKEEAIKEVLNIYESSKYESGCVPTFISRLQMEALINDKTDRKSKIEELFKQEMMNSVKKELELINERERTKKDINDRDRCISYVTNLVRTDYDHEKVFEICDHIVKTKVNEFIYNFATEAALRHSNFQVARIYLKKFCNETASDRIFYYWPIICKSKSTEQLFDVLRQDLSCTITSSQVSLVTQTLRDYIWPRITYKTGPVLQQLIEVGFKKDHLLESIIEHVDLHASDFKNLRSQNIKKVIRILSKNGCTCGFIENLFDTGFVDHLKKKDDYSLQITRPIIMNALKNGDLDIATQIFFDSYERHKKLPAKRLLMRALIEADERETLQRVVDASRPLHGEMNTMIDLGLAFMCTGKMSQAESVFSTPGLNITQQRLHDILNELSIENLEFLERFALCTKNMASLSREDVFLNLIKIYDEFNAVEKALKTLQLIQNENCELRDNIMVYLKKILERNGRPVPFETKKSEPDQLSDDVNDLRNLFKKYLSENRIDDAIRVKSKLESFLEPVSLLEECNLVEALANEERLEEAFNLVDSMCKLGRYPAPNIFKLILTLAADSGRIDLIDRIKSHLPNSLQRSSMFSTMVMKACVNNSNGEQYLDRLIYRPFPFSYFSQLLKEEKKEKILMKISDELAKREFLLPKSMIWVHYMQNKQFEEAKKVFNSCPKLKDSLSYGPLLDSIRKEEDIELGMKMIEFLDQTNNKYRYLSAYSLISDLLKNRGNIEESEKIMRKIETMKVDESNDQRLTATN